MALDVLDRRAHREMEEELRDIYWLDLVKLNITSEVKPVFLSSQGRFQYLYLDSGVEGNRDF